MKKGFTLVEMMIASAVFAMVVAGVATMFTAVVRMSRTAFTEAELSLNMRQLREKLLFHAAPPTGAAASAGLLSGDISLDLDGDSSAWLKPAGFVMLSDDSFDVSRKATENLYFINLRAEANGIVRRERIVVPVFGLDQLRNDGSVFHD